MTTLSPEERADLKAKALKATPGPWFHCQPYKIVPATRTVHGRVPSERVDYVSTWPDRGTPPGHRTIIDMPGREARTNSADMAFVAAANPAVILSLLAALEEAEGRIAYALSVAERMAERADKLNEAGDYSADAWGGAAAQIRAALSPSNREADQ